MNYICGEKFQEICDFCLGDKIPNKEHLIMYADSHDYIKAIELIYLNKNHLFTLVTHNSDDPIRPLDAIPLNIKQWFALNLEFRHSNIKPIPIGLENTHWHPSKRGIIKTAPSFDQRIMRAIGAFNPSTYPEERQKLAALCANKTINADFYPIVNGVNFKHYVYNLKKYRFCLCPRGNGIDTHRIWEALYLGCIPIVKRHITHSGLEDLPIFFIDDWEEVTNENMEQISTTFEESYFNNNKMSFSYWESKIKGTINEYSRPC